MNTQQIAFAIHGMDCARCAVSIEHTLMQLDGVVGATVNYATERATITYDPTRASADEFVRAVRAEKFDVPLARRVFRWREWPQAKMLPADGMVSADIHWRRAQLELAWLTTTTTEAARRIDARFLAVLVLRALLKNFSRRKGSSMFTQHRRWLLPTLVGGLGALALVGVYLGIISIAQSPSHALEQLAQDQLWVGLVALGFGAQVGLYTYLRLVAQALKLVGATAMTGVGAGTSTLGMIACCAHHVADFAPLVALTGATGLSGAVTFLAEWKIPFIIFGLIVNAIGIVVIWRAIRTSRAQLNAMTATPEAAAQAVAGEV